VGVKQGVRQMNIHLHIIAARVLNNFGVTGYVLRGDTFLFRFLCPEKSLVEMRLSARLSSCIFHANKAFVFSLRDS